MADYPEKIELPRQTTEVMKTHEILGERIRRRDNKIVRLEKRIKQLEKQLEFLS